MKKKDIFAGLKKDIIIPDIVTKKAQDAFQKINPESDADGIILNLPDTSARAKKRPRRSVVAAAVAAAVLITGTGSAIAAMRWSRSMEKGLGQYLSEEQKEALEGTGTVSFPMQSATCNGVTITAVQSVVDDYAAYITFRIQGFDLPKGQYPNLAGITARVKGKDIQYKYNGKFYSKAQRTEDGGWANEENEPVELSHPADRYVMDDGSLEYNLCIESDGEGSLSGRRIYIEISAVGTASHAVDAPAVWGPWKFNWTLEGGSAQNVYTLNTPLAYGMRLSKIELSPISAIYYVDYSDFDWEQFKKNYIQSHKQSLEQRQLKSWEQRYYKHYYENLHDMDIVCNSAPSLAGLQMKSGEKYIYDLEKGSVIQPDSIHSPKELRIYTTFQRIINVDDVDALLFDIDLTRFSESPNEENYYVVPLK